MKIFHIFAKDTEIIASIMQQYLVLKISVEHTWPKGSVFVITANPVPKPRDDINVPTRECGKTEYSMSPKGGKEVVSIDKVLNHLHGNVRWWDDRTI